MKANSHSPTTSMETVNKEWLAKRLMMQPSNGGIDLIDDFFAIELKTKQSKYGRRWAIEGYQPDEFRKAHRDKELYWAFCNYDIRKQFSELKSTDYVENTVIRRKVYFFPWDWILQFPHHPDTMYDWIYVNSRAIPQEDYFTRIDVWKGTLLVPKRSDIEERLKNPPKKIQLTQSLEELPF